LRIDPSVYRANLQNNGRGRHLQPFDHNEILKFEPGKRFYIYLERQLIKKFSLETHDINGAIPNNLKYKDKGKKKANFFPNSDLYKDVNQ